MGHRIGPHTPICPTHHPFEGKHLVFAFGIAVNGDGGKLGALFALAVKTGFDAALFPRSNVEEGITANGTATRAFDVADGEGAFSGIGEGKFVFDDGPLVDGVVGMGGFGKGQLRWTAAGALYLLDQQTAVNGCCICCLCGGRW